MTEEGGRKISCSGNEAAGTAREQVGAGKSRMGRVAGHFPARRVAPPLQFEREHQAGELGLPVGFPRRVETRALKVVEVDAAGAVRQTAEADHSCSVCPA